MRDAGFSRAQRFVTVALFVSPLVLCALGHDTTRWMGAMCINATLFLLYLYMTEPPGGRLRQAIRDWAGGSSYVPWMVYLLAIGPFGATGLRLADQVISIWYGP
jgi:hypothetical protein